MLADLRAAIARAIPAEERACIACGKAIPFARTARTMACDRRCARRGRLARDRARRHDPCPLACPGGTLGADGSCVRCGALAAPAEVADGLR